MHRHYCTHILVSSIAALPNLIPTQIIQEDNTELVPQTREMKDSSGQRSKSEKCNLIIWGQHIIRSPLEVEDMLLFPSTGGFLTRVWHLPCLSRESVGVSKWHLKNWGEEMSFEFSFFGSFLSVHQPWFSRHLCLPLTPSRGALFLAEIFWCSRD